ncbi:MAG: hypothetical protein H8D67_05125 [Deltaproteobacteria bacterium]|nr:hypothetical protein [Deltaproteobacteria bacterium]
MFPYEPNAGKHTLIFIAGFHLGIPLALCQTRKSTGWTEISEELSESFSSRSTRFEVISINYEPETKFPLGKPLIIQHLKFFDVFNLPKFLQDAGLSFSSDKYRLDNLIWICPSGIVLVIGKISSDIDGFISLDQFEDKIVEEHYAELTYIYTEVAEVIIGVLPTELLNSSLCCASDVEKCRRGIFFRRKFSELSRYGILASDLAAANFLRDDHEARALYDDILIDVYYIDFLAHEDKEKLRIGYVDSSIESSDPLYLLIIGIAYSSFVGLLWLMTHLGEQSRILQEGLLGISPLREGISSELKLFRIFCLQFINESSPINVRLTRPYMTCLEECWREYRMYTLVDQVNGQLVTLEKMFDWVEEVKKEVRNFKIGLAAVLLALISITAVAAQLVSTIDVNSQLGVGERILFIFIGFTIGILSTLGIYMLPIKWYARLKRINWK